MLSTLSASAAPPGSGSVGGTPRPAKPSSTSARDTAARNRDSPWAVSQTRIDVLAAAEGEPVCDRSQIKIEAVVSGGLFETGDRDGRPASPASTEPLP